MTEGDGAASDLSEPDELLEALNDEAPDGATPGGVGGGVVEEGRGWAAQRG